MAIDDDFPQILTDLSPGGEGTPGQAAREKDFSSLLQDMVLETSDVERFLADLARLTVDTLSSPGTEVFCGITLLRPNKAGTVASSSEKARGMDEIQYEFNEGPCLEAARTNRTVLVRDRATIHAGGSTWMLCPSPGCSLSWGCRFPWMVQPGQA